MRGVALPVERGAWSLWLEPVLLALLIAPSGTGALIAILSLFSLLVRQPLKIMLIDISRSKVYRRTRQGALFVCLYVCCATSATFAIVWRGDYQTLLPLIPAYLAAAAIVWRFDLGGNSRHWLPESLAAVVMSTFAVSICLASDWSWDHSAAVGVIVLARSVPAIMYVRARLKQIKSSEDAYWLPITIQAVALCGVLFLHWRALTPLLSTVAVLVLLARSIYFLRFGAQVAPKLAGIQEAAIGLVFVALATAGYILPV